MKKEDIEIISTYDLAKIDLLVHYRINAPDKKATIFGSIGLLEYFDFKNYIEIDTAIEKYVDMHFECE